MYHIAEIPIRQKVSIDSSGDFVILDNNFRGLSYDENKSDDSLMTV